MRLRNALAYTLIEILVTIAIVGAVGAGAYVVVRNTTQASATAKLERDVQSINQAVKVYMTSGGKLPSGLTGDQVLLKLRRVASDPRKVAALRQSMIDPRLNIRWQSNTEAGESDPRAYWNDAEKVFYVAREGETAGVKEFYLGEPPTTPSGGTANPTDTETVDDRRTTLDLAINDKWVWDYHRSDGNTRTGPVQQTATDTGTTGGTGPSDPNTVPLDPPVFSIDGGGYSISWFPKELTLSLPPGAPITGAEIYYFQSGGQWRKYISPITVDPALTVTAKTVSLDPDHYEDSVEATETYAVEPLKLQLAVAFPKPGFNYRELGGLMVDSSSVPAANHPYGNVTLTNASDIPAQYTDSNRFQIFWTYDGSDPTLPAGSRVSGPEFTGSVPEIRIPVDLGRYGTSTGVSIKVVAVASDTTSFITSDPTTVPLGIEKTTLAGTDLRMNGSGEVIMGPVNDPLRMPAGTVVFFTADHSDPGDNGHGEPTSPTAVLFTAPVTPPVELTQYTARSYPPGTYKEWFVPGDPASLGTGVPLSGYLFATTGNSPLLYQFDTANGQNIIRTSACPFPPACVAYNGTSQFAYYIEKTGAAWQLGRFSVITAVHETAGALTAPAFDYVPSQQPLNLVAYNESLFYIAENSDDLIRIDVDGTGNASAQYKFADVTGDAVAFTGIGDIAADSTGTLYISSTNAWATFNLRDLSGYSVPVTTPSSVWAGLVVDPSGALFGVRTGAPQTLYSVNKADGSGSNPFPFNPVRSFDDFGGPLGEVPYQFPPGHYAITPGRSNIHRLDLASGRQYIFNTGSGMQPSALAFHASAGDLYVLGTDTAGGNPILKRLTVASGDWTVCGSLNDAGLAYQSAVAPAAAAWFAGSLYYVGPGTDDLIKVTIAAGSIAAQVKHDDMLEQAAGHGGAGTVDALTIGEDGLLYMASSDTHRLASYDIAAQGGYNIIKGTPEAAYTALTVAAGGTFFGVPATSPATRKQLFSVDEIDGAQSFIRNVIPALDISDISGLIDDNPAPLETDFFAVDGTTTRIYRFDPPTGRNTVLTSLAPWPAGAVAFDAATQRVYYTKAGAFDLGCYHIATGLHTQLTALNAPALNHPAPAAPANLTFFNGALYYVPPGTDDLVRVELTAAGDVAEAWKEADLNGDASIGTVGDLAVDPTGLLYLSSDTLLARYDLRTLSGWQVISSDPGSRFGGLYAIGTVLHGVLVADPRNLYAINTANGSSSLLQTNRPSRVFVDTASTQPPATIVPITGAWFASVTGRKTIYHLDVTSGSLVPVTASCPELPEAVAYDPVHSFVYYTEVNAAGRRLYRYDLAARTHSLAGDLSAAGLGYSITESPRNLVYFQNSLFCIPSGDDLVEIRLDASGNVASLVKLMDVSGNTRVFGNAGALAVDNTGWLYIAKGSGDLLGKVNFYARSDYSDINTTSANLVALTFSPANVLYGAATASPSVIESIHLMTGARTFTSSTTASLELRDASGLNNAPRPPLPDCFAVGGGNTSIYQFDPNTGAAWTVTAAAPFNLNALARNPASNVLYYLENTAANWRLGRYSVSTDTHSVMANLGTGSWTNIPSVRPHNLFYFNGHLYFIAPASDDLYQIRLNTAGTAVTNMARVADITGDTVSFDHIGDVAVDLNGRAYLTTSTGETGYFSMVSLAGYTQLASGLQHYGALIMTAGNQIHGSSFNQPTAVSRMDSAAGTFSAPVESFPGIVFWDMAGQENSVPYRTSDSLWAISENTSRLGEFIDWNLPTVSVRNWGEISYLSNGTPVAFTSRLENLVATGTGTAWFVRNEPTVINSVSRKRPLFTLNLATLTWGPPSTPPVATFVGDLEQALSALGPVGEAAEVDDVYGLALRPDGRLFALYSEGNSASTDYLIRINSFATNSAGALTNVSIIGPMTGATGTVTSGQDLVFGSGGILYVTDDADDHVYSVDPDSGAVTGLISVESGLRYEGMTVYPPTGELLASNTESGNGVAETMRTIRSGNNNDTTRFNYLSVSASALPDIEAVAFPSGSFNPTTDQAPPYFAVDLGQRIYRVNPLSGVTTIETAAALFNAGAVAYNGNTNTIYYVEHGGPAARLAKYENGVHTSLGDLLTAGSYHPASAPQHLISYNDRLYYISPGTSDLVRITVSGGAITLQDRIQTLQTGAAWTVTAAVLDNTAQLYFAEGTTLRRYDLRNLGNLSVVSSTVPSWQGLLGTGSAFYASRTPGLTGIESADVTTGSTGATVATNPAVQLYDLTGANSAPAPDPVETYFYAVNGTGPEIYVIEPDTGRNNIIAVTNLFSRINAVAADETGSKVYYIQDGSPYGLGVWDRASDTHTLLTSLASAGTHRPVAQPTALTMFNGHLYFMTGGSDDLIKIELRASGQWNDNFVVAEVAGGDDTAFGANLWDLAVDRDGWLYISGTAAFAKYNLASMGGYAVLGTAGSHRWAGLMTGTDGLTIYGVRDTEPDRVYVVNTVDGSGAMLSQTDPVRMLVDCASPQQPVTFEPGGDRYFVTTGSKTIHRLDLETGTQHIITSSLPYFPTAIAMNRDSRLLYLVCYTGTSVAVYGDIRLLVYDLSSGQTTDAGSLRAAGLSYQPSRTPLGLVYAGGKLFYVPPATDDLVQVTLSSPSTIAAADKIADVNNNTSLGEVDALTFSPNGRLYVGRNDIHQLSRYNFQSLAAWQIVRDVAEAKYSALTFSDAGVLHGMFANDRQKIQTLSLTNGEPTLKTTTTVDVWDITGLNSDDFTITGRDLWAVTRTGTNHRLVQFENYDKPTLSRVEWGDLRTVVAGITTYFPNSGPPIQSLAATNSGIAYFVASGTMSIGGSNYRRPLFRLNLNTLVTGAPQATFIGDLELGMRYMLGLGGPVEANTKVTGLAIHPVTGALHGLVTDGLDSTADRLFRINALPSSGTDILDLTQVGLIAGGPGDAARALDLGFSSSGDLYVADGKLRRVYRIDAASGTTLTVFSSEATNGEYGGLAIDPDTSAVIGAETGTRKMRRVLAGTDTDLFNFNTLYGYGEIEAAAFLTAPVTWNPTPPATYYAVDGSTTIYSFDLQTGTVQVVNPTSPALFNAKSLAYDPQTDILYYIEDLAAGFQLAKYNLLNSQHTLLGNLQAAGFNYSPTAVPANLEFYDGALYYVHAGTDDLVRIDMNATSIVNQTKLADLSFNSLNFGGNVTELAIDREGWMFISSLAGLYKYNLPSGGAFGQIYLDTDYAGIFFDVNGSDLYGTAFSQQTFLYAVNRLNGNMTELRPTSPEITMLDYGGHPPQRINIPNHGTFEKLWVIDEGDGQSTAWHLYSFGDYTDPTATCTDFGRLKYIHPTLGLRDVAECSDMESLASNPTTGQAYFMCGNQVPGGPTNSQALFTYNLNDGTGHINDIQLTLIGHMQKPNSIKLESLAYDRGSRRLYSGNPVDNGENSSTVTDTLVYVDLRSLNPDPMLSTPWMTVGLMQGTVSGTAEACKYTDGMEITGDGRLFVQDGTSDRLFQLDHLNGQIIAVADRNTGGIAGSSSVNPDIETIFWDQSTSRIVGIDNAGHRFIELTLGSNGANVIRGTFLPGTPGLVSTADFEASALFTGELASQMMIGNLVYLDNNANGVYDVSVDTGVYNVVVQLYLAGDNPLTMAPIAEVRTASDGTYSFRNLVPQTYMVHLPKGNFAVGKPLQSLESVPGAGTDETDDNGDENGGDSADPTVTGISSGAIDLRIDTQPTAAMGETGFDNNSDSADDDNGDLTVDFGFRFAEGQYYAVNGTNTIYKVAVAGATSIESATAPFAASAAAFDRTGNVLYYLENANVGFRIGKYNIATGVHSIVGNLQAGTLSYIPSERPEHLLFSGGDLFYVAPGTDDLIRVILSPGGVAPIVSSTKVADVTDDAAVLYVTAAAVDSTGRMLFTSGGTLFRYQFSTLSGWATVNTLFGGTDALLFVRDSDLFVAQSASSARLDLANPTTGAITQGAATLPPVNMRDLAGPSTSPAPVFDNASLWAVAIRNNGSRNNYPFVVKFRNYGSSSSVTVTEYGELRFENGSGATAFPLTSSSPQIESFSVSANNIGYFVVNQPVSVGGVTHNRPLFRVDLNISPAADAAAATTRSVVAQFAGDLDTALQAAKGSAITWTSQSDAVTGTALGLDGSMFLAFRTGGSSVVDKLLKLTSLAMNPSMDLTAVTNVGNFDMPSSGELVTDVESIEIRNDGTLYVYDASDRKLTTNSTVNADITTSFAAESSGMIVKAMAWDPIANNSSNFFGTRSNDTRAIRVNASSTDTSLWTYSTKFAAPSQWRDIPGLAFAGRSFNETIPAVPNAAIYIAGDFARSSGDYRGIARLDDGLALDTTFNVGTGVNSGATVSALERTSGGLVAGGNFISVNGTPRMALARFKTNGLLDSAFVPDFPAGSAVWTVKEQADGRLLVGGSFTSVNGTARNNIARLMANGTLDTSFDPGLGPNGAVLTIDVMTDGSVLAGGDFLMWNGVTSAGKIAMLSSTGARNTGWTSSISAGAADKVSWVKHTTSGILVGGKFTLPANGIARLTLTGAHDTSFATGTGVSGATAVVNRGNVLSDGSVLVAGDFTSMNGTARNRIVKLQSTGAVDSGWSPGSGFPAAVNALLTLPGSGFTYAVGSFASYGGITRNKIVALQNATGGAAATPSQPSTLVISSIHNVK